MSDQLWRCVKCGYEYRPAINCIEVCCPHHLAPLYMDVVEGYAPPTTQQLNLAKARQAKAQQKLEEPPNIRRIQRKITR